MYNIYTIYIYRIHKFIHNNKWKCDMSYIWSIQKYFWSNSNILYLNTIYNGHPMFSFNDTWNFHSHVHTLIQYCTFRKMSYVWSEFTRPVRFSCIEDRPKNPVLFRPRPALLNPQRSEFKVGSLEYTLAKKYRTSHYFSQ